MGYTWLLETDVMKVYTPPIIVEKKRPQVPNGTINLMSPKKVSENYMVTRHLHRK